MGHAIEISDYVVARRRPEKSLRREYQHAGNLSAYIQPRPKTAISTNSDSGSANPNNAQRRTYEYIKLGSQPSDQLAANSDTAFVESESWISTVPRYQLAFAAVSCLTIGAVVGYHWSSSVNGPGPVKETTSAASNTATSENIATINNPNVDAPVRKDVDTEKSISAANHYVSREQEYLDEIDWLMNRNSSLTLEVDVLKRETLDQNNELLKLELRVAALQAQSEPPTETRVVYNFVNVPIGAKIDSQPSDSYVADTQASNTQTNIPVSDFVENNNAAASATAIDKQLENSEQYIDYRSDGSQLVDESDELLRKWEIQRQNYPYNSAVSYDPDTGFYINPNYSSETDESQRATDVSENISYPPIAND